MADRMGTCAECDARYKIPATFKGTRAKCKKCGGIVEIPPLEEKAAPAAGKPKAASEKAAATAGSMKGAKAGGVRTKARPRRGKASTARRAATRSRRGGGDEDEGGTPSWVWIVAGVSLVGIVIILIVIMSGDDENVPDTPDLTSADTIEETAPDQEPVEETLPEETTMEEDAPAPEATAPVAEVAEDPADVDPIIKVDALPPIIGCDQDTFDRLTYCFEHGFLKQELPPRKRKPLKTEFDQAGFERAPILLNSFDGLDLLNADNVVVAFRIAEMWNKMTGKGFVDVPIKGDTAPEEMEANLSWNRKGIISVYGIWARKVGDQEAQRKFFSKCEEKVRKANAREAAEDE